MDTRTQLDIVTALFPQGRPRARCPGIEEQENTAFQHEEPYVAVKLLENGKLQNPMEYRMMSWSLQCKRDPYSYWVCTIPASGKVISLDTGNDKNLFWYWKVTSVIQVTSHAYQTKVCACVWGGGVVRLAGLWSVTLMPLSTGWVPNIWAGFSWMLRIRSHVS